MSSSTLVAPAPVPRAALTTRFADFWLLGGLSLALWTAMVALQGWRLGDGALAVFTRTQFAGIAGANATLMLLLNGPHFLASYRLAYGRGFRYVRERWFALIVFPAALLAALAFAFAGYGTGVEAGGSFRWLGRMFLRIGLSPPIGPHATAGGAVMTLLIQTMLLTVGWHYSKQVYGCMMVYARYDGYPLTDRQRAWIRWSLHSVAIASYVALNLHRNELAFLNVPYYGLGFPYWLHLATTIGSIAAIAGCALHVVRKNGLDSGRRPSLNFVVPYIAFLAWWFPLLDQVEFTTVLVPAFHAIQYLPFVFRVERAQAAARSPARADLAVTLCAVGLVVAGALAFDLLPGALDHRLATPRTMNVFFFTAAAAAFINIHHYAIDSVIWKTRDRHVGGPLFGARTSP